MRRVDSQHIERRVTCKYCPNKYCIDCNSKCNNCGSYDFYTSHNGEPFTDINVQSFKQEPTGPINPFAETVRDMRDAERADRELRDSDNRVETELSRLRREGLIGPTGQSGLAGEIGPQVMSELMRIREREGLGQGFTGLAERAINEGELASADQNGILIHPGNIGRGFDENPTAETTVASASPDPSWTEPPPRRRIAPRFNRGRNERDGRNVWRDSFNSF